MFADIEQKIIDRLRAKLGEDVSVEPLRELERVPSLRQKAPAAWVIYDGYKLGAAIPGQAQGVPVQQVELEWFVVLAAKSARGNGDPTDARDQAADMAAKVIEALLGFPVGGGKYLRLSDAPGPEYDAGYCHLPLSFTCGATFKGQP